MKTLPTILLRLVAMAFVVVGPSFSARGDAPCTITVKILVDQKEPTVQKIWERRYRDRVAAASAIFERTCGVRFQVVAAGTWQSDDSIHDLIQLIGDFERKVNPAPAQLALGFTGQYQTLLEDKHIGGARGPFRSHVLIREWGRQITEPERLEILVHELGHYLGAVHSPEHQSVMRPDISDRQSRARDFQISFDARNAAAMSLIGNELAKHPLVHLGQLPPATKQRLRAIYQSLAAGLPGDPAAPRYLAMLDESPVMPGGPPSRAQDDAFTRDARNSRLAGKGPNLFPKYKGELTGSNEVQIVNPNDSRVWVGLRSAGKGRNFVVSPGSTASAYVPDGVYNIYVVYSNNAGVLYHGESFALQRKSVRIGLAKTPAGSSGVRPVK